MYTFMSLIWQIIMVWSKYSKILAIMIGFQDLGIKERLHVKKQIIQPGQ